MLPINLETTVIQCTHHINFELQNEDHKPGDQDQTLQDWEHVSRSPDHCHSIYTMSLLNTIFRTTSTVQTSVQNTTIHKVL